MIQRANFQGRIGPDETVELMADLHESFEYQEELLEPWYLMREELVWGDGYQYPRGALSSVEEAVGVEWSLLDRRRHPPVRSAGAAEVLYVGLTQDPLGSRV